MAQSAIYAIIASLIVVSIYITLRFQWKFAVPVLIALMHDLLITSGVYALVGREVTASTVAALLTILGFSLYDTIVVFDRVRENIPRMPNAAFSQIYNRSMSEVIVRSLATSFCAGAADPRAAAVRRRDAAGLRVRAADRDALGHLLVGVHRRPGAHHWKEREPVYKAREARIRSEFGGVVPAYAVATAGAPVDVAPSERKRRDRLTTPADPSRGVSERGVRGDGPRPRRREEPQPPRRRGRRPAGGGRRRARAPSGAGSSAGDKPKKPRNRRHGRPR